MLSNDENVFVGIVKLILKKRVIKGAFRGGLASVLAKEEYGEAPGSRRPSQGVGERRTYK